MYPEGRTHTGLGREGCLPHVGRHGEVVTVLAREAVAVARDAPVGRIALVAAVEPGAPGRARVGRRLAQIAIRGRDPAYGRGRAENRSRRVRRRWTPPPSRCFRRGLGPGVSFRGRARTVVDGEVTCVRSLADPQLGPGKSKHSDRSVTSACPPDSGARSGRSRPSLGTHS